VLTLFAETFLREPPSRRGSRRGSRRNPGTLVAFYSTTVTIMRKKTRRRNTSKMSRNSASVNMLKVLVVYLMQIVSWSYTVSCGPPLVGDLYTVKGS
jgi:hypothetical protein